MSIRVRLLLLAVAVITVGFSGYLYWLMDEQRGQYLEALEVPLVDSSQTLAGIIGEDMQNHGRLRHKYWRGVFDDINQRRFKSHIYELEKHKVDLRVYVTGKTGIVLFDSDNGRDEGVNYANWRDVALTLKGKYGARSSKNDPINPDGSVKYIAAPIIHQGEIKGVVSIGKPVRNIDFLVQRAQHKVFIAGTIALLILLIILVALYYWVSQPLHELVKYARRVSAGKKSHLPNLGNNEIAEVGREMEAMHSALDGKAYIEHYAQTLTHEIKSPLSAIKGSAELLQSDMPIEQQKRFLEHIDQETDRIQALITQLLDLVALEKQSYLKQNTAIDLPLLIREVITSQKGSIEARALRIDSNLPEHSRVMGDEFLLRHAIANLVKNAIDFSPHGERIQISLEQTNAHQQRLLIEDGGPGIPLYALDKIYDRFYSPPIPNRRSKGTGLGLAFVKEVAALHQGSIQVTNGINGGARAELLISWKPVFTACGH